MAAIPIFPLLGLPDKEILRTIRVMSLDQILTFSLISENCKELVKSIKIKGTSFSVMIRRYIRISIKIGSSTIGLHCYSEPSTYWEYRAYGQKKKLAAPNSVHVNVLERFGHGISSTIGGNSGLSMKDWLKHLQDIFSCDTIEYIKFERESSQFDIDDVREVFGKPSEVRIGETRCNIYNELILQKYFPIEKLSTETFNFQDSKSILLQHFLGIRIGKIDQFAPIPLKLEDLLMINSKSILIFNLQMSPKDFNKFIKLWQSGSNPHMEHLWIYYKSTTEGEKKIIMEGIKHDVIPYHQRRKFKSLGIGKEEVVRGGRDIYRKDGTKATIEINISQRLSYWRMFIWMDHCIV